MVVVARAGGALGKGGRWDFLLQRISAVVLGLYAVCIVGFFAVAPVDHARLVEFFSGTPMLIFSLLAVLALVAHAWIGMWTVGTDYVNEHYFGRWHAAYRTLYLVVCAALIAIYVYWPMAVIWRLES